MTVIRQAFSALVQSFTLNPESSKWRRPQQIALISALVGTITAIVSAIFWSPLFLFGASMLCISLPSSYAFRGLHLNDLEIMQKSEEIKKLHEDYERNQTAKENEIVRLKKNHEAQIKDLNKCLAAASLALREKKTNSGLFAT